jgi:hypothetical protein
MSNAVGEQALNGEWERISNKCFEIQEDMIMEFEGRSCNITDSEGNPVPGATFGPDDGLIEKEVLAGFRCYIMRARVKFKKKEK